MKRTWKKTLALVMSLAMMVSLFVIPAAAEEAPTMEFSALQAALASDGNEVTLTGNVTVPSGENVLDLQGRTVHTAGYTIEIPAQASLTVRGNGTVSNRVEGVRKEVAHALFIVRENGTLKIEDGTYTSAGYNLIYTAGSATILNGTFECTKNSQYDAMPILCASGAQAKLTIVAGSLKMAAPDANKLSDGMYGIYCERDAAVELGEAAGHTGPTVDSYFAAVGSNNLQPAANITIYGGTYSSGFANPTDNSNWEKFCAPLFLSATGAINISGGTFRGAGNYALSIPYTNAGVKLNISGGTFQPAAEVERLFYIGTGSGGEGTGSNQIQVTGGTFEVGSTAQLTDAVALSGDHYTVSVPAGTIELTATLTIDNSITLKGAGAGSTTLKFAEGKQLKFVYRDGTHAELSNLTVDGSVGGGVLNWSMDSGYRDNDTPTDMPTFTVDACTFINTAGPDTGAGMGLWAPGNPWSAAAASEVTVKNSKFKDLGAGIYWNEEAPLLNLKAEITNNVFEDLSWGGIVGLPANASITGNDFLASCGLSIQYLFNKAQTVTQTVISDNRIESVRGIELMPYHLNEGNNTDQEKTVLITGDMVPVIKRNIRHGSAELVTLTAYRAGTDETAVFEDGALDLTENYTDGKAPAVKVTVQTATGDKNQPTEDELAPVIKADVYYLRDTMQPADLSNYVPYVPPVTPPKGETTTNPDGSTTTTKTDANGAVTETTKGTDGSTTVVETKADGSVSAEETRPDGTKGSTAISAEGAVRAEATVSAKAAERGETVVLPVLPIPSATQPETAPVIDVKLPAGSGAVTVAVPVEEPAAGLVAVLVHEDGTEEILKKSVLTDAGLALKLEGSATIKVVDAGKQFGDTEEAAWAADAVAFVTSRELFQGVGEGAFAPNAPMTRGMLVTVLNRLENEPAAQAGVDFADVTEGAFYAQAVAWAAESGIVEGTGSGFAPDAPITREQLATFVYRYLKVVGALKEGVTGDVSAYPDGSDVSGWAGEAMGYAVGSGLFGGRTNGRLDPKGQATRAEVATVLQRLVGQML